MSEDFNIKEECLAVSVFYDLICVMCRQLRRGGYCGCFGSKGALEGALNIVSGQIGL